MSKNNSATEADLVRALRVVYPQREYAVLSQVANSTGFSAARRADAVAMSLWPSRGLHLHGFECKSDRADWKRELEAPEKAEEIASRCHYWWIVAGNDKIVKPEELPEPWGLYVHESGALKKIKPAQFRRGVPAPSWQFVATMMRQAQKQIDESALRASIEDEIRAEAMKQGMEHGEQMAANAVAREKDRADGLQRQIAEFEAASGVNLATFRYHDPERLGRAFQHAINGPDERLRNNLIRTAKTVLETLGDTDP